MDDDHAARSDGATSDRIGGRFGLSLPSDSRHIRLARLMASGIATSCGLTLEEIEDLRIAVDEVCATLVEMGGGDTVELTFELTDDALVVTGLTDGAPQDAVDHDRLRLSRQILNVVADDHSLQWSDAAVTFAARKRLPARGVG